MLVESNGRTAKKTNLPFMEQVRLLEEAALNIRKDLIDISTKQAGGVHIGADMSCCDVAIALWKYQMEYDVANPKKEDRDRFILSKGHSATAISFCQAAVGCYEKEDIYREYATDNGRFGMHSCNLLNPHVEVSTGSLGHGMPVAAGMAMGIKLKGNTTSRVYTIMGDGEQAEGSVWEAALNAAKYKLGNLVVFVDNNNLSVAGALSDVSALGDIAAKYRVFGWNVVEIDGHDMAQILDMMDSLPPADSDKPTCVVCHTVKGKGVSFMENDPGWHAGALSEEDAANAILVLEKQFEEKWGEK